MSVWNTEITLQLIEDLRENPCLWDASSPLFRFRNKKSEIYEELAKKYSVSPFEVEKKLQGLKCQFRREHKKIRDSHKNTRPKCNWFGYTPMLFLSSQIDDGIEKSGCDTTDIEIESDMLYDSMEPDDEHPDEKSNSQLCSSANKSVTEFELEPTNELAKDTLHCMKQLIDVVTKRDEFSVYGDYIADKLRSSGKSKMEIHIAQHHMENVAFNLIMGVYGRGATSGHGLQADDVVNVNASTSTISNLVVKEEEM